VVVLGDGKLKALPAGLAKFTPTLMGCFDLVPQLAGSGLPDGPFAVTVSTGADLAPGAVGVDQVCDRRVKVTDLEVGTSVLGDLAVRVGGLAVPHERLIGAARLRQRRLV
jgi:hypothetical protein